MSASQLLSQLLDYVLEQDKDVDPRGYRLSTRKGFIKGRPDLQGLPGVDVDVKVEGDHLWLRVARLAADAPPAVPASPWSAAIVAGDDPHGPAPHLDDAVLGRLLAGALASVPSAERPVVEARSRAAARHASFRFMPKFKALRVAHCQKHGIEAEPVAARSQGETN